MAKTKYDTPDANGWRMVCDDLFLARFRGRACEVCGSKGEYHNGRFVRSMGHHVLEKDAFRLFRYDPQNIVTLCLHHHGRSGEKLTPHGQNTWAVLRFYEWMRLNKPEQYSWALEAGAEKWDKSWTYKEMYVRLGGEIKDGKFKKDEKPLNHAAKVREIESRGM